jgi:hypothetical protein
VPGRNSLNPEGSLRRVTFISSHFPLPLITREKSTAVSRTGSKHDVQIQ